MLVHRWVGVGLDDGVGGHVRRVGGAEALCVRGRRRGGGGWARPARLLASLGESVLVLAGGRAVVVVVAR